MTIWSGFRGKSGRDSREVEQMVSGRIFDTRRISRISLGVILLSVSTAGCGQDMSLSPQESLFRSDKQTDPCRSLELEVLSPVYNIFFSDPTDVYFEGEVIKVSKLKTEIGHENIINTNIII